MKRTGKLLSLLLATMLLFSLLPMVTFAASGTEEDPIVLEVGETVSIPSGTDAYLTFTPPEDGVYTLEGLGTVYASNPIETDVEIVYESAFFHGGFTYRFKMNGSVFDEKIHVLDEGRLYNETTTFGRQEYLIWDFDPDTGTLTIDPGVGDGEMASCGEDLYPWDPLEAQIRHLIIGEGVINVPFDAFSGMLVSTSNARPEYGVLEDVSFPSTIKHIGQNCFRSCGALKEVSPFPAGLETVEWEAFAYCPLLESVTFEGPTAVGFCAFSGCTALADVTIKDPNMTEFGEHSFRDTAWVRSLASENKGAAVVNNVLIGSYAAFDKKPGDGILVIPDGVTKIAPYAVSGTTLDPAGGEEGTQVDWNLVEVVIPDSVKEIGESAFSGCTELESVSIGDGVTTLPKNCFAECYEMRTVNFGKNVRVIEYSAFYDTWLPGDLVIPDTIVSIGKQAFHNDEFPLGATWINHEGWGGVFENIPYRPKDFTDRTITIGPAVTEIGARAFYGWTVVSDDPSMTGGTATIRGYDGTCAEKWAKENDFSFESLGPAPEASSTWTNPFSDVLEEDYFFDPVKWAVQNQVTNGTDETHFSPDNDCTRAQMVTFLWRAKGCPEPTTINNPFIDLENDSYYEKAVLWAVEQGITKGTSDITFSPSTTVTRGQTVTFLWRMEGNESVSVDNPFDDVVEGQYYTDAVLWAVKNQITTGKSENAFAPDDPCTRGQIVTFLYRDIA